VVLQRGANNAHREEISSLRKFINIIRIIKSRRLRWVGHAARIREKRNSYRILVGRRYRDILFVVAVFEAFTCTNSRKLKFAAYHMVNELRLNMAQDTLSFRNESTNTSTFLFSVL
jgi:hypothetical protein